MPVNRRRVALVLAALLWLALMAGRIDHQAGMLPTWLST